LLVLLIGVLVLLGAGSAQADSVTIYTDLTTWQAAARGTTTTEDFADRTLATSLSATFGSNASISGRLLNVNGQLLSFPTPSVFTFISGTSAFGGLFDLTPGGNGVLVSSERRFPLVRRRVSEPCRSRCAFHRTTGKRRSRTRERRSPRERGLIRSLATQ